MLITANEETRKHQFMQNAQKQRKKIADMKANQEIMGYSTTVNQEQMEEAPAEV